MDSDSYITLTDTGMEIARHIYESHKLLTEFFMHMCIDEATARETPARWSMTSAKRPLRLSAPVQNGEEKIHRDLLISRT